MQAANQGAGLAGGRSVGLNIGLPQEQRPNPYVTRSSASSSTTSSCASLWFAHLARALVAFPGGFGTFDELFEILTLAQTRKLERSIPVFLYRFGVLERSGQLRGSGAPRHHRGRGSAAVRVRG